MSEHGLALGRPISTGIRAFPIASLLGSVWLPVLIVTGFASVFIERTTVVVNSQSYFSLFDDAMISMQYARNLAEGHGLVWNPGQPAVEGYTNFLWVLWMAFLHLLPVPESKVALLVMLSGVIILVANVLVMR